MSVAVVGLCLLLGGGATAHAAKWDPVDPADLAAKESMAFPGADAEVLLSTYRMEERGNLMAGGRPMDMIDPAQMETDRFFRAKFYTAAAAAHCGKIVATYPLAQDVNEVAARVLHPDGTSSELSEGDIVRSEGRASDGSDARRLTFAFPGLGAGDIVEFQLRTVLDKKYKTRFYAMTSIPAIFPKSRCRCASSDSRTLIMWAASFARARGPIAHRGPTFPGPTAPMPR